MPRPFPCSLFLCFFSCLVRRLLPQPHRGKCIAICVLFYIDLLPKDNRKHNTNPSAFTLSMLVYVVCFCCVVGFAVVSSLYFFIYGMLYPYHRALFFFALYRGSSCLLLSFYLPPPHGDECTATVCLLSFALFVLQDPVPVWMSCRTHQSVRFRY